MQCLWQTIREVDSFVQEGSVLRVLFPIKDGDIFDRNAIAKGLENLREAYGELGYINFTSVPDTKFDDDKKLCFLEIDMDEGKQFYVSSIDIVGADPQVLNDLPLTPGHVYNVRLVHLIPAKASTWGRRTVLSSTA